MGEGLTKISSGQLGRVYPMYVVCKRYGTNHMAKADKIQRSISMIMGDRLKFVQEMSLSWKNMQYVTLVGILNITQ